MFRFLFSIVVVVAIAAVVAPGIRETLGWVLAFLCALLLGDLLRSSLDRVRRRGERSAPRRT